MAARKRIRVSSEKSHFLHKDYGTLLHRAITLLLFHISFNLQRILVQGKFKSTLSLLQCAHVRTVLQRSCRGVAEHSTISHHDCKRTVHHIHKLTSTIIRQEGQFNFQVFLSLQTSPSRHILQKE